MRQALVLSASFTVLALATAAHGQARSPAAAPDVAGATAANAVEEVAVVANRSPELLSKVGQSVTVLTLPELRADQETVVSDILARTPGITFSRNGGVGETTSLRIRGAETDQTVVLIDGVKLNDPSSPGGGYNFADLATGDIARIEILRGPQSTLYGSQAIGGVVNIITNSPTKPFQGDAQIEGGAYNTGYAKAGVGGVDGKISWRVAGSYLTTDGVSAFDRTFGGIEDDGYHNTGLTGRFGYDFTPDISLDLRAYYARARNAFDAVGRDDAEFGRTQEFVDYTGLNFTLFAGRLKNRIAGQYTEVDRQNYNPAQLVTTETLDASGDNTRLEYQGIYAIAPGYQATFGAEHERSTLSTASPTARVPAPVPVSGAATIDSGYGQIQGEVVPGLNLTGGLRYDDHSTFGSHTTGQAAAAWSLHTGTIVRASWGQGFKAPTLYQLETIYGNLALQPEKADGWDGGLEQKLWEGRIDLQATYFSRDTTHLIVFVSCPNTSTPQCANGRSGYYNNVQKTEVTGVELSGAIHPLADLSITANYTSTDAKDRSPGSATFGKELARRPRGTANFGASYVWPFKLTTGVAVRYASRSFDNTANTTRLKSYTLVDLRASYPLGSGLELYGRIENLTDKAYETTYRYGSLGRAGYLGVRGVF